MDNFNISANKTNKYIETNEGLGFSAESTQPAYETAFIEMDDPDTTEKTSNLAAGGGEGVSLQPTDFLVRGQGVLINPEGTREESRYFAVGRGAGASLQPTHSEVRGEGVLKKRQLRNKRRAEKRNLEQLAKGFWPNIPEQVGGDKRLQLEVPTPTLTLAAKPYRGPTFPPAWAAVPNRYSTFPPAWAAVLNQGTPSHAQAELPNRGPNFSHALTAVPNRGPTFAPELAAVRTRGPTSSSTLAAVPNRASTPSGGPYASSQFPGSFMDNSNMSASETNNYIETNEGLGFSAQSTQPAYETAFIEMDPDTKEKTSNLVAGGGEGVSLQPTDFLVKGQEVLINAEGTQEESRYLAVGRGAGAILQPTHSEVRGEGVLTKCQKRNQRRAKKRKLEQLAKGFWPNIPELQGKRLQLAVPTPTLTLAAKPYRGPTFPPARAAVPNRYSTFPPARAAVPNRGPTPSHAQTALPNRGPNFSPALAAVHTRGPTPSSTLAAVPNRTSTSSGAQAAVPNRAWTVQPKYDAQTMNMLKVFIVREAFPLEKLSLDDIERIQREILRRTDMIPFGNCMPKIQKSALHAGTLLIYCDDAETVNWLKTTLHGNDEVIGGIVLKVLSANDLPKPIKIAFKTKDVQTKNVGLLLRRLNRLNPELKSAEWRFIQKVEGPYTIRWIFEVDWEAAEAVKKADYGAYTGLDRGTFKILNDPNKSKDTRVEPSTSSQEQFTRERPLLPPDFMIRNMKYF